MTNAEVLRWFGERAMPILQERYPALFEDHSSARNFILSVNNIIHPEVRKLYSGASCPFFHFRESDNGRTVTMGYESSRKMCDLARLRQRRGENLLRGSGYCPPQLHEPWCG
ncbi:hypothetical protein ABIA16_004546 [Sinorhizobium fredii]